MELRVATFNIQHGLCAGGEVDIDLLAKTCRSLNADILALQEVDRHLERTDRADTPAAVAEACGMNFVFGPAIAIRGGEYGNALLARGEIGDIEVIDLPRPSGKEARAALVADVTIAGLSIATAVTHLSVPMTDSGPQLEALVPALAMRPGPHLLLGDLNRPPDALDCLIAAGYSLAEGEPTWPARAPRRRIDHIAVNGFEILSVTVAETPCSDHRPLMATVRAVD